MPKMNPEVKAKWLEALRSGKYKQGDSALHKGEQFCCLGVLCDIAVQSGIVKTDINHDDEVVYDGRADYLPLSVQEWAGLPNENGDYDRYASSLADQNDEGATFTEIADIIEKHF